MTQQSLNPIRAAARREAGAAGSILLPSGLGLGLALLGGLLISSTNGAGRSRAMT